MHFPPKKCCLILEIIKLKLEVAAMQMNEKLKDVLWLKIFKN